MTDATDKTVANKIGWLDYVEATLFIAVATLAGVREAKRRFSR